MVTTGTLLTVLSNIPWGQVVENAPKLAEGATRLWGAVRGSRAAAAEAADAGPPDEGASAAPAAGPTATERLAAELHSVQAQVLRLQTQVTELQAQLQASSGLVKELAEQNAQLVQHVERQRVRLQRLALAGGAVALGLVVLVAVLLLVPGLRG